MNYEETLEYLYSSTPVFERVGASAYKEGLSNTIALDEHLSHPHTQYKCIHVAGTNGKGSTSHTLAAILQSAGYKVGLYTSPHLVDFSERIRVNGEPIEHDYVVKFVEENRAFFEPLHPSFFELSTAMAFRYFADKQIDIAVIEVGLGGRLDCTNIITPILSVITNISFDHTGFLGTTLEAIAGEKAGIIKPGIPVVIGEYNEKTFTVFKQVARSNNSDLTLASDKEVPQHIANNFELRGACQENNIKTIYTSCMKLCEIGIECSDKAIEEGTSKVCEITHLRGRWEILQEANPRIVCDTGHNLAGWQYIAPQLKSTECNTLRIVFGMVDDKDIDGVMELLPKEAEYYFCQATTHRAIPVEKVHEKAMQHGINGKCFSSVIDAYSNAKANAGQEDFIFIGGSSYVVADLLTAI